MTRRVKAVRRRAEESHEEDLWSLGSTDDRRSGRQSYSKKLRCSNKRGDVRASPKNRNDLLWNRGRYLFVYLAGVGQSSGVWCML